VAKLCGWLVSKTHSPNLFDDTEHFVGVDFGIPAVVEEIILTEIPLKPLEDFSLKGGDFRDPKTMDKNASIHLNGIEAIYESGRLYMDFILSTGERSSLPKPDTKNKVP